MKMPWKKTRTPFEGPDFDVLIHRAEMLDSGEALEQMETALNAVNRYASEYRRTRDVVLLEELKMSAEAFYVLADVLSKRQGDAYGQVQPARQRGSHY